MINFLDGTGTWEKDWVGPGRKTNIMILVMLELHRNWCRALIIPLMINPKIGISDLVQCDTSSANLNPHHKHHRDLDYYNQHHHFTIAIINIQDDINCGASS